MTMEAKDIITAIALIVGPVAAVLITLWHQKTSRRHEAKERLFMVLMAHRKANPPTVDWANSLNLIDVVFEDSPSVVEKWHETYNILTQQPWNQERWVHSYIELLSEMAVALGYNRLRQTDIDRFYAPQALGTQAALALELQTEVLTRAKSYTISSSHAPYRRRGSKE
jgi:hypothetical protein